MIVVADSGPLHYLILLQHIELLRRFYGQVLVPEPVANELLATEAPAVVREWITRPPGVAVARRSGPAHIRGRESRGKHSVCAVCRFRL
jgi:hypothetical protein